MPSQSVCDEACEQRLYLTRQIRTALGKHTHKIQRLLLKDAGTELATGFQTLLNEEHSDLKVQDISWAKLEQALAGHDSAAALKTTDGYYLADFRGFIMMYYGEQHTYKDTMKDVKFFAEVRAMSSKILGSRKPGFRLALFATLFAFVVIGLGAFTRLVDAGLGCPDWPGCYGHVLWPNSEGEVQRAEQLFPDAPVEHDKTWPEMVHRYVAASLGLFAIALLVIAARNRGKEQPFKHVVFLLILVIVQGLFGHVTVTLKLWPQVVTAHLLGGFLTVATLWLLTLRLSGKVWRTAGPGKRRLRKLYPFALLATFVLLLQIALGGWTTSNYADVACPDFPTCQEVWLPEMDFAQGFNVFQSIGPNYLGGKLDNEARVSIHFAHRVGAIIASLFISKRRNQVVYG